MLENASSGVWRTVAGILLNVIFLPGEQSTMASKWLPVETIAWLLIYSGDVLFTKEDKKDLLICGARGKFKVISVFVVGR